MQIVPALNVQRFEQLDPGDLFILISGSERFYALKTMPPTDGEKVQMVVLGPRFIAGENESFLLNWQASTVLSYGKQFSVVPSSQPEHWLEDGNRRTPVCLAISADQAYICANAGHSRSEYAPRYVNISTGAVEHRLSYAVFTAHWRIEVVFPDCQPVVLIQYPSPPPGEGETA
jgi:hypothetical protein